MTIDPIPARKQPQQQQSASSGGKKPNRQKARKDRKAQALKELQDEAEQEAAGQVNMNEVERKAIEELAKVMGVVVKDVTADGHCLYNAIADQLSQHYQTEVSRGGATFRSASRLCSSLGTCSDSRQSDFRIDNGQGIAARYSRVYEGARG